MLFNWCFLANILFSTTLHLWFCKIYFLNLSLPWPSDHFVQICAEMDVKQSAGSLESANTGIYNRPLLKATLNISSLSALDLCLRFAPTTELSFLNFWMTALAQHNPWWQHNFLKICLNQTHQPPLMG